MCPNEGVSPTHLFLLEFLFQNFTIHCCHGYRLVKSNIEDESDVENEAGEAGAAENGEQEEVVLLWSEGEEQRQRSILELAESAKYNKEDKQILQYYRFLISSHISFLISSFISSYLISYLFSYLLLYLFSCQFSYLFSYTVVPAFNGPSDERTPAMSGHFLNVRTVLPC